MYTKQYALTCHENPAMCMIQVGNVLENPDNAEYPVEETMIVLILMMLITICAIFSLEC